MGPLQSVVLQSAVRAIIADLIRRAHTGNIAVRIGLDARGAARVVVVDAVAAVVAAGVVADVAAAAAAAVVAVALDVAGAAAVVVDVAAVVVDAAYDADVVLAVHWPLLSLLMLLL